MKGGYWEDRGYPKDAKIQHGKTLDVNSAQIIEISGWEVVNP